MRGLKMLGLAIVLFSGYVLVGTGWGLMHIPQQVQNYFTQCVQDRGMGCPPSITAQNVQEELYGQVAAFSALLVAGTVVLVLPRRKK